MTTDCLLIGFNSSDFPSYVDMVRSMGDDNGAYRDLNLAFINYDGKPHTAMDLLNRFHFEDKDESGFLHNCDFLWPTIIYLGTFLQRRGFTFDYVNLFQREKDQLREKLERGDIRTVAITTTLYVSPHPIIEIISFIRQYNEEVKIVVGGPYISNQVRMLDLAELQKHLKFIGGDYYIISQEGEQAFVNLLTAMKEGGDLSAIDNLAWRRGDDFVVNELTTERNALQENMVDYSLFPSDSLGEFVSLRTAKSCPFSCAFCGFPQRAGKYTYLDLSLVEQELEGLAKLGNVSTVTFLDDTFNVPKKRFREILRLMIDRQWGFRWNSFYRSDHGDEETIRLMAEAGCEGVFLGIESGSDAMLKTMNKTARRHNYLAAIPLLQQLGISVHCNFIVGFPSETFETYSDSIGLIEEAKPDFYRAQLWYCDPVTPIWQRRHEFGVKGSSFNWSHNTMDYQTACDWVDRFFLGVESSTWLPQNGFEQWSTFYLQRQGMSMPQLKRYLRAFNACVKEKLITPTQADPSPHLIRELQEAARFDQPQAPQDPAVHLTSGDRYMAAEAHWHEHFRGVDEASCLHLVESSPTPSGDLESQPVGVEPALAERLRQRFGERLDDALLATFAVLVAQISGRGDAVLVAGREGAGGPSTLPLRLPVAVDRRFEQLLEDAADLRRQAAVHERYGFHIVTNPWRMDLAESPVPALDAGFLYSEASAPGDLRKLLADRPEVAGSLALVLETTPGLELRFRHDPGRLPRESVEELSRLLLTLLERVSQQPETEVGSLATGDDELAVAADIEADASEAFNF